MELMRLNKYLVQAGVCSRREADRLIEAGDVLINDKRVELGQKVDGTERITVRGRVVGRAHVPHVYIAYNKPVGVICTSDPSAPDNIIDAINFPERIFHIGRLDVASSGLILLTNDGDIVNAILRAEGHHEKEYIVRIDQDVTREMLRELSTGVPVLGHMTLPAHVKQLDHDTFSITIVEGRNRQIRRMCEVLGVNVISLQRVRIMHIHLGNLPVGRFRYLEPKELQELLRAVRN